MYIIELGYLNRVTGERTWGMGYYKGTNYKTKYIIARELPKEAKRYKEYGNCARATNKHFLYEVEHNCDKHLCMRVVALVFMIDGTCKPVVLGVHKE